MLLYAAGVKADFERRAAEATLLALREIIDVKDAAFPLDYQWLPSLAPLTREQVIEYLMAAPKPVTCVALPIAGSLAVGTWPTYQARDVLPGTTAKRIRREMESYPVPGRGDDLIALLGATGEVRLTHRELRVWREAYELPMIDLAIAEEHDQRARSRGVACVAEFRPAEVGRDSASGGLHIER